MCVHPCLYSHSYWKDWDVNLVYVRRWLSFSMPTHYCISDAESVNQPRLPRFPGVFWVFLHLSIQASLTSKGATCTREVAVREHDTLKARKLPCSRFWIQRGHQSFRCSDWERADQCLDNSWGYCLLLSTISTAKVAESRSTSWWTFCLHTPDYQPLLRTA